MIKHPDYFLFIICINFAHNNPHKSSISCLLPVLLLSFWSLLISQSNTLGAFSI